MGITKNCSKFLSFATTLGVSFSETIMLGRQVLYVTPSEFEAQLERFKIPPVNLPKSFKGQFAEPLFNALGARVIDSLDYSDFENATIIHDLNDPIPNLLQKRYTTVFDGGTLEHVFNFPQAIKNCIDMLQVGGHFVSITPTNNQCGHGFYQFSPELFFSLFDETYGFKTKSVILGVDVPGSGIKDWYAIKNPQVARKRVTLSNSHPTYLMVIAEKVKDVQNISVRPMQSDYELVWEVYDSIKKGTQIPTENKLIYFYRRYTPELIKNIMRRITGRSTNVQKDVEGLGQVNPAFFEKLEV